MTFKELRIIPPILKALEAAGYEAPTPIQEAAIPANHEAYKVGKTGGPHGTGHAQSLGQGGHDACVQELHSGTGQGCRLPAMKPLGLLGR